MVLSGIDTFSFNGAVSEGLLSSSAIYDWDSGDLSYNSGQALKTWKGNWIAANDEDLILLVPPVFSPNEDNREQNVARTRTPTPEDWELTIQVESNGVADQITKLGVLESASDGFDPLLDYPEPPSPPGGSYITAYFPHDDWSAILGSRFNYDIRGPLIEGEEVSWDFEINGTTGSDFKIIWGEVSESIPSDYSAWLYVPSSGDAYDMFEMDSINLDQGLPFNAQIIISSTYLSLSDVLGIPTQYALHQNYPNPFNPTTQIRYDLPEDAMVSITIYDIMGRSIRSLVKSRQTAGYRSIQWNATNNLGEPVSAGMYIYMIQTGEFRQTKKMVLLK